MFINNMKIKIIINKTNNINKKKLTIAIQRGNKICFTNSFDSVIQNGTD